MKRNTKPYAQKTMADILSQICVLRNALNGPIKGGQPIRDGIRDEIRKLEQRYRRLKRYAV